MKRTANRHGIFRRRLARRLDGLLSVHEAAELEIHLGHCAACRATARDLDDTSRRLRSAPSVPVPRDLWARTAAALDREMARATAARRRMRRLRLISREHSGGLVFGALISVGLILVVAANEMLPGLPSSPTPRLAAATPFAVRPQSLALVTQDERGLRVYRTEVDELCPEQAADCTVAEPDAPQVLAVIRDLHPQSLALAQRGELLAIRGLDRQGDGVYAVLELTPRPAERGSGRPAASAAPRVTGTPRRGATGTAGAGTTTRATKTAEALPSGITGTPVRTAPTDSPAGPRTSPRRSPSQSSAADPMRPIMRGTPSVFPGATGSPSEPTAMARQILSKVAPAGAPPAWSRDGDVLAFSALPADRSHGPDIYTWRPGETVATALTSDHATYFASWAGSRIVASRVTGRDGKAPRDGAPVIATSVVVDPRTGRERPIPLADAWLPVVDPIGRWIAFWQGRLVQDGVVVTPLGGRLFLAPWGPLDPFVQPAKVAQGAARADGPTASPAAKKRATRSASPSASSSPAPTSSPKGRASARSTASALDMEPLELPPVTQAGRVVDWQLRWTPDGSAYGIWVGDPASGVGRLAVYAVDPSTGAIERGVPLVRPTLARESFTLGDSRAAFVMPVEGEVEGELRVQSWGPGGSGALRIKQQDLVHGVPAF